MRKERDKKISKICSKILCASVLMADPIDVSMNLKPPDDGGSSEKDKATFRDTLIGSQNMEEFSGKEWI
ncbi:M48 family peptidase [Sesbania bispinosa]|nr:M48 family peptidase [Sesbania bispinosa]